jgi:hypothetical protein
MKTHPLTRRAFLASAAALAVRVRYVGIIGASALGSGRFRDVVQDQ